MTTPQISKNGNSYGISDVSYIYFPDQQSGVLLPSIPGYPDWLPQLQLTKSGRLCFWNFPNDLAKAVISKPSNAGTFQYCRDLKKVTAQNPFPPVPYDYMMTNGNPGQYFWNSCNINGKITQDVWNVFMNMEAVNTWVHQNPPGVYTLAQIVAGLNVNQFVKVGDMFPLKPMDWIFQNVQFYINQYLNVPYDVRNPVQYGKTWQFIFETAAAKNDLQGWLSVCNFLLEPKADPSTWDKVAAILPTAILTVVGGVLVFVSAGAATPLLAAMIKKINGGIGAADAQNAADAAAQDNASNAGGINFNNIPGYVAAMTTTQKIMLGAGVLLAIVIVFYLLKHKKK